MITGVAPVTRHTGTSQERLCAGERPGARLRPLTRERLRSSDAGIFARRPLRPLPDWSGRGGPAGASGLVSTPVALAPWPAAASRDQTLRTSSQQGQAVDNHLRYQADSRYRASRDGSRHCDLDVRLETVTRDVTSCGIRADAPGATGRRCMAAALPGHPAVGTDAA